MAAMALIRKRIWRNKDHTTCPNGERYAKRAITNRQRSVENGEEIKRNLPRHAYHVQGIRQQPLRRARIKDPEDQGTSRYRPSQQKKERLMLIIQMFKSRLKLDRLHQNQGQRPSELRHRNRRTMTSQRQRAGSQNLLVREGCIIRET